MFFFFRFSGMKTPGFFYMGVLGFILAGHVLWTSPSTLLVPGICLLPEAEGKEKSLLVGRPKVEKMLKQNQVDLPKNGFQDGRGWSFGKTKAGNSAGNQNGKGRPNLQNKKKHRPRPKKHKQTKKQRNIALCNKNTP